MADYNVYFDQAEIDLMADWQRHLQDGLSQCCLLAPLVSPRSLASEPCQWEWEQFTDLEARLGLHRQAVLPIVLEYAEVFPSHGRAPADQALQAWVAALPADHPHPAAAPAAYVPRLRRRIEDLLKRQLCPDFAPHFARGGMGRQAGQEIREPAGKVREAAVCRQAGEQQRAGPSGEKQGETRGQERGEADQPSHGVRAA